MKQSLIQLNKVSREYKIGEEETSFFALKDVTLEIKRGEFVAITGPSGSGKSTLMNVLGLLDKPTHGVYFLDGKNTSHLGDNSLAEYRNKKIGFVFQSFNLLSRTSALENVALPLVYSGVGRAERIRRAKQVLEDVGLAEKLSSRPNQLSGGQQQRVAIARALVTNPEVILADEPTGNLDTKNGEEVMLILKRLHKAGRTIILITHERDIAKNAKRIITVKDGQIRNN